MVFCIFLTIFLGVILGRFVLPPAVNPWLDAIVTYSLASMVLIVGIDIGRNRTAWDEIRTLGFRILLVPLAVASGSIGGACMGAFIFSMPLKEAAAIGAGFGWYSLSGVILAKLYSVELGTMAFLANVSREMMSFILIPLLVKYMDSMTAIAPGGATTMDSTLPLITKLTDPRTALVAFFNGLVLSALVPLLVPFFISI